MTVRRLLVLIAVLAVVAACGSSGRRVVGVEPSASSTWASTGGRMPTTIPAAAGTVTSKVPVTILDDGDGPEVCLGSVATSLPPQCGGPKLVGWAWADHRGRFETRGGVRWGEFAVTGRFDGTSLTLTEAVPSAQYDGSGAAPDTDLTTPCPAPPGGWRVLDPATTTDGAMSATFARASRLPGYAEAWMDQSRNPAPGRNDDTGEGMNDPTYVTINVRVARDVGGAVAELRKIWGGALCVSMARHTQAELLRVQHELKDLPGMLSSWPDRDAVAIEVVHDDGSLQAWADATYGRGVVRISSALVPASG